MSEKIKGYAERLAKLLADGSSLKEALALIEPEKPVRQAPPILVRSKRRRDETPQPYRITVLVGTHVLNRLHRARQGSLSAVPSASLERIKELNERLNRGEFYPQPGHLNTYCVAFNEYGTMLVLKSKPDSERCIMEQPTSLT